MVSGSVGSGELPSHANRCGRRAIASMLWALSSGASVLGRSCVLLGRPAEGVSRVCWSNSLRKSFRLPRWQRTAFRIARSARSFISRTELSVRTSIAPIHNLGLLHAHNFGMSWARAHERAPRRKRNTESAGFRCIGGYFGTILPQLDLAGGLISRLEEFPRTR